MSAAYPVGRPAAVISLEPRTAVLLISGLVTVLLTIVLALLPVPYAVLRPGPVLNTLGSVDGKKLITISGRRSYPPTGVLDMTTVATLGGPGRRVTLAQVLAGWLDGDVSVVPQELVFPPDATQEQTDELNREQMVSSQQSATVAALTVLGIQVPATLSVAGVSKDAPAASVLRKGDVIVEVDGHEVGTYSALRAGLRALPADVPTTITVRRDGERLRLRTRTAEAPDGRTVLGVLLDPSFRFPFDVEIQIDNVGGPSAGLVFALGIVDNLTPGELTGGRRVAGTGTIDADGTVGPIGGIQQKLIGARQAGAHWFLAPAENCAEVVGHVPDGLQVLKVTTLAQARSDLQVIASGAGTAALPRC